MQTRPFDQEEFDAFVKYMNENNGSTPPGFVPLNVFVIEDYLDTEYGQIILSVLDDLENLEEILDGESKEEYAREKAQFYYEWTEQLIAEHNHTSGEAHEIAMGEITSGYVYKDY